MNIRPIAEKINKLSADYKIGDLQQIRKKNKSLEKLHSNKIFSSTTIFDGYAFHDGGRTELQYNIGFEENKFRYGLAFSLMLTQALPDISIMYPKIRKFNYLVRHNPSLFAGYKMWAWTGEIRTNTETLHEIESSLVKPKAFIFFGKLIDPKNINYGKILSTFDKMLPIYEYIESGNTDQKVKVVDTFTFKKTNVSLPQSRNYTLEQAEIEIDARHSKIQEKLVNKLNKEYGVDNVSLEHPIHGNKIDIVVNDNGKLVFYEIKTAPTARDCIRQALGQILDYAYWPGKKNAERLCIVGENLIDKNTENYVKYLNTKFGIKLDYLQIKL
jgi:hypothetical protein